MLESRRRKTAGGDSPAAAAAAAVVDDVDNDKDARRGVSERRLLEPKMAGTYARYPYLAFHSNRALRYQQARPH
jgi:hypothetical protein